MTRSSCCRKTTWRYLQLCTFDQELQWRLVSVQDSPVAGTSLHSHNVSLIIPIPVFLFYRCVCVCVCVDRACSVYHSTADIYGVGYCCTMTHGISKYVCKSVARSPSELRVPCLHLASHSWGNYLHQTLAHRPRKYHRVLWLFLKPWIRSGRLCCPVVTVPDCISRGPGSIPGATRFREK
jgi:hypothetical protein